ncbi:unnamed protein product [Calypogeia fissa]
MLARAPVGKMIAQLKLGKLIPVGGGCIGGSRFSAVNVQPLPIVRCSSHNAIASEDPSGKPYISILKAGGHTFKGDLGAEPWGAGGTAPEPKDYAFAALALCTSMTVRLYANRKNWPLKHVEVEVQEINGQPGKVPEGLHAILKLEGDLTDEQKNELIKISASCPIKQIFSGKMKNGITSEISAVVSSV